MNSGVNPSSAAFVATGVSPHRAAATSARKTPLRIPRIMRKPGLPWNMIRLGRGRCRKVLYRLGDHERIARFGDVFTTCAGANCRYGAGARAGDIQPDVVAWQGTAGSLRALDSGELFTVQTGSTHSGPAFWGRGWRCGRSRKKRAQHSRSPSLGGAWGHHRGPRFLAR